MWQTEEFVGMRWWWCGSTLCAIIRLHFTLWVSIWRDRDHMALFAFTCHQLGQLVEYMTRLGSALDRTKQAELSRSRTFVIERHWVHLFYITCTLNSAKCWHFHPFSFIFMTAVHTSPNMHICVFFYKCLIICVHVQVCKSLWHWH